MDLETAPFRQFEDQITTLDLHAGGEPIRLVIDGLPPIPGETMNDKRVYVRQHLDHVRLLLTREPRGHRDMFAAIVTDPVSEDGDFGIIFMDPRRYPYMCGHGTIGAVTAFLEMGWLEDVRSETTVVTVDAPAGPVRARPRFAPQPSPGGHARVESVAIELESAFVFARDQVLDVPGWGAVTLDVAFAGGFGLLISNEQLGLPIRPENGPELARFGMAAIEAANQQLEVQHPTRPYMDTVDSAEIYDPRGDAHGRGKNAMIYGEGHVDRSACGTGTSVKMALLHRRGQLDVGETYVNESILGTTFEGRILRETTVGARSDDSALVFPAIVPKIRGSAHVTGLHRFTVTPSDPFPTGFRI
jgi:proline racemase/trans-L-3-hydroxyproline dehydratase